MGLDHHEVYTWLFVSRVAGGSDALLCVHSSTYEGAQQEGARFLREAGYRPERSAFWLDSRGCLPHQRDIIAGLKTVQKWNSIRLRKYG